MLDNGVIVVNSENPRSIWSLVETLNKGYKIVCSHPSSNGDIIYVVSKWVVKNEKDCK